VDVRDIATDGCHQAMFHFYGFKSEAESIIETAQRAQKELQSKPLQDRLDIVLAGIKAIENMGNEKLVQDLAKMMGRPDASTPDLSSVVSRWCQLPKLLWRT